MANIIKRVPGQRVAGRWEKGYVLIRCDCGREIRCDAFTNTCECGADYNWEGSRLAPREQWGEETGETAADILRPGDPFEDN